MNLGDLKQYVSNVTDYDATANPTYDKELTQIISDAYERVYTEKPWLFAQKSVDIEAKPDVTGLTIGVSFGSATITHSSTLDSTMDGAIIELEGVEYIIAYVKDTSVAYLTEEYRGATGSGTDSKVIFRYLDLPADCVSVMNVSHRTNQVTPEDPGMMVNLSRYEDEMYNLPLGETGTPRFWVTCDPVYISPPFRPPTLATRAVSGKGDRTIEVAIAHEWAGRSSGLSPFTTVTLTPSEDIEWDAVSLPNNTGLYRTLYVRFPNDGFQAWYNFSDYSTSVRTVNPVGGVTLQYDTSTGTSPVNTDRLPYQNARFQSDGGMRERFRLHPRQAATQTFTVRYLARPLPLVEESDTPNIPAAHRLVVAYKALETLLMKTDAPAQSQLYAKRAEKEMMAMGRKYLLSPSRRITKGDFTSAGVSRFNRFTPLTRS